GLQQVHVVREGEIVRAHSVKDSTFPPDMPQDLHGEARFLHFDAAKLSCEYRSFYCQGAHPLPV
ncbi:hypothetical protein, partial [Cereibacter changlensis]|uniref:hypothetical protein n=1 Tax=Cereibacter changlensis TaxID=402884 RepID=UPI001B864521